MAGRNLSELLEHLRAKPHHHRHNIAVGVSAGVTGLVAVAWVVAMGTSGSFSLKTDQIVASGAGTASDVQGVFSDTSSNFSKLMGAAGAAVGATTSAPSLNIVETRASSTLDQKPQNATDATSISF